jgi:hypothetical protein
MPGAGLARWLVANSISVCDTAAMAPFSRTLRRLDMLRTAAAALGVAVLLVEVAYVYGIATSQPLPGGVVSAIGLAAIAGSGLLYAWRLGTGGLAD